MKRTLNMSLHRKLTPEKKKKYPTASCREWGWGWGETEVEEGRDVAQLVEHRTSTPLTQVRFIGAAGDFSLRVNFQ